MKSVFIIGPGRSGTTLLYKILCLNENFAWISNYMARFPNITLLSALNRINRKFFNLNLYSWFGKDSNAFQGERKIIKKILPTPVEGEKIYEKGGFKTFPDKDWCLGEKNKIYFVKLIDKITKYQGKTFFLSKRTANNRRIEKLIECFPEAKFINIVRDGRAVAFSLTKVKWWDNHKIWWLDRKTPRQLRQQNYTDIELAATNWVEEITCINNGIRNIHKNNLLNIRYEDLVLNPEKHIVDCLNFLGIEPNKSWLNDIKKLDFYNSNDVWKSKMSAADQEIVMKIQKDKLQELNYL